MAAGRHNIIIEQGADFGLEFTIKEDGVGKNLTGYSPRAQLRPKKESTTLSATFGCTMVDAANGVVKMALANATTSGIAPGKYFYDFELYTPSDTVVTRVLEGEALVTAEVTR